MKKGFVFLLLGILLIGVALFLVTANLMGWDVLGWFGSKQALLIYLIIGILGITALLYWWKGRN